MSVTLAIRWPLGRYHATPWDRSVNEGAVEWPPSPWRILRALVATWYTRWPDLPGPVLDGLLAALGDQPAYRTPTARPGHTRHYLPDISHKTGEPGGTALTLDAYLRLSPAAQLLVRWETDLSDEQRDTLAKLAELVPYLGRADSVCEIRLLDSRDEDAHVALDDTWWRPGSAGDQTVRMLAPSQPIQRSVLEQTTVEVRKGRRTQPTGTTWVTYSRANRQLRAALPATRQQTLVDAIRFAVVGDAPITAANGVLLADEVHRQAAKKLDGSRADLLGRKGANTDHQHAHWVPLSETADPSSPVSSLLVWVPAGLTVREVAELIRVHWVSGRRSEGYQVKGLPPVELLLQATGPIEQVAPELCGTSRRWRSLTPYLPVRYPKRQTLDEYLAEDVRVELGYRGLPAARVGRLDPEQGMPDHWAREYRRRRLAEHLGKTRRGLGLTLEFEDEPRQGPLLLGQLSHFGYGIFVPE